MATKLDMKFAKAGVDGLKQVADTLQALILEVIRLEGLCEEYEKLLMPEQILKAQTAERVEGK